MNICIVSNIGRNCEIVQDGVNGFLADSEGEWIEKLSRLFEQPLLRKQLGLAGRKTVEDSFAAGVYVPQYLDIFKHAVSK